MVGSTRGFALYSKNAGGPTKSREQNNVSLCLFVPQDGSSNIKVVSLWGRGVGVFFGGCGICVLVALVLFVLFNGCTGAFDDKS